MPTALHPVPRRPHRMGTIFDHLQIPRFTDRHQRIHVTDMPPHMAQQQHIRLFRLRRQIIQIDHQPFAHPYKHRYRAQ